MANHVGLKEIEVEWFRPRRYMRALSDVRRDKPDKRNGCVTAEAVDRDASTNQRESRKIMLALKYEDKV